MYDLVAFGDITIDLYFKGKDLTHDKERFHLAYGGKYYAEEFYQSIGGSGGNVAINAASLGLNTAVVAKVGETGLKNVIIQSLVKRNVSSEFLIFDKSYMSVSTILLGDDGERTIIKYSDEKVTYPLSQTAFDRIRLARIIFMGNLSDIALQDRVHILEKVTSSDNVIALNLNATDCELGVKKMGVLLKHANVLVLNKYEFSALIGEKPDAVDLSKDMYKVLGLSLDVLVVTDSKRGSYAYVEGGMYHQPASDLKVIVDSTGAGDAFTSGFLSQYKRTGDIQKSLIEGTEHAKRILKKIGAH